MEKLPQINDSLFPITYEHLYRTTISDNNRPSSHANPDLFIKSAKFSQTLLEDAKKVVDTLAQSESFSKRVMAAAQESNKARVTAMIQQTGVQTVPDILYNPDGIRLDFHPKTGEDLCHVIVSLKWINF